jgi:hypothetical protein
LLGVLRKTILKQRVTLLILVSIRASIARFLRDRTVCRTAGQAEIRFPRAKMVTATRSRAIASRGEDFLKLDDPCEVSAIPPPRFPDLIPPLHSRFA